MRRRTFLQATGAAAGLGMQFSAPAFSQTAGTAVTIVLDLTDPVASAAPSKWAVKELFSRIQARKGLVRLVGTVAEVAAGEIAIVVSGPAFTAPAVMPITARPPAAAEVIFHL